jgi:hypothetical protein
MRKILYTTLLLYIVAFFGIQSYANATQYITLANPSVFLAKDDWQTLGTANLSTEAVLVSGQNAVGGLFTKETYSIAGASNKGFNSYFKLTHVRETGSPSSPILSEGMVVVFARDPQEIGSGGDGKGYRGMDRSVGIEVDLISQSNDFATMHIHDQILVNGINPTVHNGLNLLTQTLLKQVHIWIDYSDFLNLVFVYVNSEPVKPSVPTGTLQALAIKNFFDTPFHIGVTSSTATEQTVTLNEVYFSSTYTLEGIKPLSFNYVTDKTPPTEPAFTITRSSNLYNVSIGGSTDAVSGVSHYEYSFNQITWERFIPGTVSFSSPGLLYARSIDRAGNVSETSRQQFFEVEFQYGVIKANERGLYYLGQDLSLPLNVSNATEYISEWKIRNTDTVVTNINALTGPTILVGQVSRHLFNISYDLDGGTGTNLPTSYSILSQTLTLPTPTKIGYAFTGFYNDQTLINVLDSSLDKDLILEARYAPLVANVEIYDYNNNVLNVLITTAAAIRTIPPIDVPDGFTFIGYFTEPFGQGVRIDTNTFVANAHAFKIYPHIVPNETQTSSSLPQTLSLQSVGVVEVSPKQFNYVWLIIPVLIVLPIWYVKRGVKRG